MSSNLPTLIVDERQMGYLTGDHPADIEHAVRIDGPLPTVTDRWPHYRISEERPLRAGDQVTLAVKYVKHHKHGRTEREYPFATASVTDIKYDEPPQEYEGTVDPVWLVTVTDVEAL